ncbi:MAG: helicase-related protein, partial [Novosphingobium sp.]
MAYRLPDPDFRGADSKVTAVLGPTNTGKTHLAIERLCAHSSGAIGFPLRLLAREVYDRVAAIKGPDNVALITGEERIEPKNARWLLCTVEAMPTRADLAFMALDEAQLCADRERGHLFTERLLHARGREETMILGSATLEPLIRSLLPEAHVVSRPRFSTLSHAATRKLSRVPPRSAIVAFSAEQVYAVAEMLRRFRGGAAVVMGALSPETRNKQVALFQSGEVDYLVATDAIGMGLNLDVTHVAFAGLSKFDGQRKRR